MSPLRGLLVCLAATLALGPGAAVAVAPATGVIAQKQGRAGCVSLSGTGGACARGRALESPAAIAVSADGRNAYVASPIDGIAVFDRDLTTGALTQKAGRAGCMSDFEETCRETLSAGSEYAITVSPDGRSVYSAGLNGCRSSIATRPRGVSCRSPARPAASTRPRRTARG